MRRQGSFSRLGQSHRARRAAWSIVGFPLQAMRTVLRFHSMGYSFVGVLVTGVVLSIAELR